MVRTAECSGVHITLFQKFFRPVLRSDILRGKTRQPFGFTAATSRINAYRGLRSLLILHKPSAAKMYYSTRLPVLQVFFGIFIKFF